MSFSANFSGLKGFTEKLEQLNSGVARKVLAISATESVKHGRTVAKKTITDTYTIKAGDAAKSLKVKPANTSTLSAEMRVTSPMTPIIKTSVRPGQPQPSTRPVVNVEIVRGQVKPFKGAFVAVVGQGSRAYSALGKRSSLDIRARRSIRKDLLKAGNHLGLFERTGKKRFPIKEKYTVGPAQMVFAKRTHEKVVKETSDYYQKRVIHNIGAAFDGFIK